MTDPAILEALIFMTHEIIDRVYDEDGTHRDMADEIAAAVLELVGPRELMWEAEYIAATGLNNWTCKTPHGNELRVFRAWWGMQNVWGYVFDGEFYYTDVAAQAAAQAHADAAHWANCPLGKLAGVV